MSPAREGARPGAGALQDKSQCHQCPLPGALCVSRGAPDVPQNRVSPMAPWPSRGVTCVPQTELCMSHGALSVPPSHACPVDLWMSHGAIRVPWSCACPTDPRTSHGFLYGTLSVPRTYGRSTEPFTSRACPSTRVPRWCPLRGAAASRSGLLRRGHAGPRGGDRPFPVAPGAGRASRLLLLAQADPRRRAVLPGG